MKELFKSKKSVGKFALTISIILVLAICVLKFYFFDYALSYDQLVLNVKIIRGASILFNIVVDIGLVILIVFVPNLLVAGVIYIVKKLMDKPTVFLEEFFEVIYIAQLVACIFAVEIGFNGKSIMNDYRQNADEAAARYLLGKEDEITKKSIEVLSYNTEKPFTVSIVGYGIVNSPKLAYLTELDRETDSAKYSTFSIDSTNFTYERSPFTTIHHQYNQWKSEEYREAFEKYFENDDERKSPTDYERILLHAPEINLNGDIESDSETTIDKLHFELDDEFGLILAKDKPEGEFVFYE